MRLIRLRRCCFPNLNTLKQRWRYILLCKNSLIYNIYGSAFDVAFEPIVCIVDLVTGFFGIVFVILVVILISTVVIIFYMDVIPFLNERYSVIRSTCIVIYGHYLLLLISFHYYKSVSTKPGKPPSEMSERIVTTVCKRCILPKPPRTHHCSVCKSCVLKMDHHCPWVNNCVGHFNHRYFILFCIFMWLGVVYVSTTSWPLFRDCFNVNSKTKNTVNRLYDWMGYDTNHTKKENEDYTEPRNYLQKRMEEDAKWQRLLQRGKDDVCIGKTISFKNRVVFLWFLCSAVVLSLGFLTIMHIKLVSSGQTTIEQLINKKEKGRLRKKGKVFANPYDYGFKKNWQLLLGFYDKRSFIKYVLLPIPKLPKENGLEWNRTYNL